MSLEDRRSNLHALLHCAMMVELTTIPAYLSASFSLVDTDPSGEAANAEAQELLRSVLVEEMLHMVLVSNILNAVGGRPVLDRAEWVPRYPAHLFPAQAKGLKLLGQTIEGSRPLRVHLRRFGKGQVEAFMEIEGPLKGSRMLGAGIGLRSIGQFYEGLAEELKDMVSTFGEEEVFSGDPERQVGPEYYYAAAGEVIVVDSHDAAQAAITKISEEGEGLMNEHLVSDGDVIPGHLGEEPAHYYRFKEIVAGRRYLPGARWEDEPTGAPIKVDWDAAWPAIDDPDPEDAALPPDVAEAMRAFDRRYTELLRGINRAFDGAPELLRPAVAGMFELKQMGVALMRTPLPGGRTAAPAWRFAK